MSPLITTLQGADKEYQKTLESRFNLLDIIETKQFDQDPVKLLIPRLEKTKKQVFLPEDRYVIVLFDTCYYLDDKNLVLHNLMTIWKFLDIPLYTMILYTNHFGITKEFSQYYEHSHAKDRPLVIETIFNPTNYDEEYDTHLVIDPNISQIEHSVLCLMAGAPRVHRQVLYADLKDIDDNDLVMTIRKSEYADIQ